MISNKRDILLRRLAYKYAHLEGVTPSALNTSLRKKEQRMHGGVYMYTTREFADED